MTETTAALVALSQWIDAGNAHRDPEAILWGRVAKIGEEFGEAMQALIGYTGQNPRKGFTHSSGDLTEELLDVAVTALGAIEHIRGHDGRALAELEDKILRVHRRALGVRSAENVAVPLVGSLPGDAERVADLLPGEAGVTGCDNPSLLHDGQLGSSLSDLSETDDRVVVSDQSVDGVRDGVGVHVSRIPDAVASRQEALTTEAPGGDV